MGAGYDHGSAAKGSAIALEVAGSGPVGSRFSVPSSFFTMCSSAPCFYCGELFLFILMDVIAVLMCILIRCHGDVLHDQSGVGSMPLCNSCGVSVCCVCPLVLCRYIYKESHRSSEHLTVKGICVSSTCVCVCVCSCVCLCPCPRVCVSMGVLCVCMCTVAVVQMGAGCCDPYNAHSTCQLYSRAVCVCLSVCLCIRTASSGPASVHPWFIRWRRK